MREQMLRGAGGNSRCWWVWAVWAAGLPLQADEFLLTGGGVIRGQWLNPTSSQIKQYEVATEYGGRLTLTCDQVAQVRRATAAEQQYERGAPQVADTVEQQWQLAEWCRQQDLQEQAQLHLRRVVELDPEHAPARYALGYSELGGRWVTRAEQLTTEGYVRFRGQWRLPQAVELTLMREAEDAVRKDWWRKLNLWRSQYARAKHAEALHNIQSVRCPQAVDALSRLLLVERDEALRHVLLEALDNIAGDEATLALVQLSLGHPDEEVFAHCIDRLVKRNNPDVVRKFARALKDNNPLRVNRSAHALGRLGDSSAVVPLIDALETVHRFVVPGRGAITSTFSDNPEVGAQVSGPAGPQEYFVRYQNHEALRALVALTGTSFGFDQRAWRDWHGLTQRQATAVHALRGE